MLSTQFTSPHPSVSAVWGGSGQCHYLALELTGFLGVSCGEQPGKLINDAQLLDQLLTPQQRIHSPLFFMFHDVLGLHGVVLYALHQRNT